MPRDDRSYLLDMLVAAQPTGPAPAAGKRRRLPLKAVGNRGIERLKTVELV